MIMIVGGAFQGKTEYAKKQFLFSEDEILDCQNCDIEKIFTAKCINNYHVLIKRLIAENSDPICFTERLCVENVNAVVIMNEIGCGIIPLDREERKWRELTGRCGCIIAENSESVIRINCGIANIIKGELE